jgi:predicted nucleic acid-binding protein
VTSPDIEDEYQGLACKESVRRLFERHGVEVSELVAVMADAVASSERVFPTGTAPPCRDEDDRKYLHCVVTAKVPWLVSRDPDLLDIGRVDETSIVGPERFLEFLVQAGIALDD